MEHPYAARWLAAPVELSGHREAIFKSDGEPAALKLKKMASERVQGVRLVPEEKPSRDSQANPDAETANAIAEGLCAVTHGNGMRASARRSRSLTPW